MPISKIKSSGIEADSVTGSSIVDGTVTSADLDTNIAITGDLTVDTNTLHVDSANNLVGINTSSPSSFNGGANNLVVGSGSGSEGITIYADSASNSAIFFADGTSGSTTYTGQINYLHSSDALSFHTNGGTERLRILSAGGITFNGDTAAANALDDYEEGDFAYTLPFSTSGSMTVRAGYERGYYTKVGRMVTVHLRFESNGNSGSLSGDLRISGFPFNFANVAPTNSNVSYVYPLHLRGVSSTSFDYDLSFYFLADPGTNYGRLIGQGEGNSHAQTVITSGDIPSNIEGTLAFTYLVNA